MKHVAPTESEVGTVIETRPGIARVQVTQSGICAHCDMASSCVPTSGGTRVIEVADPLGVSAHQKVRIELSSGRLIGASFLAYMLPIAALFCGALLGFYAPSASKEFWGGIGALMGLVVGLLVSRAAGFYFAKHGTLTPTITAVVPDDE
ncbi:MAG: hypothetical protein Kow0099_11200 [Candidatus Abyssubacteria bacterium]